MKTFKDYLAEASGTFGVRWQEFDRNDRVTTKEKFFKTEAARSKFIDKISDKSNFKDIVAYSN